MKLRAGIGIATAIALTTIAPTAALAQPGGGRVPMAVCDTTTPLTVLTGFVETLRNCVPLLAKRVGNVGDGFPFEI